MSGWDARFFIAIFPNGEWCKIHTFSGGKRLDRHCLSALEGLDGAAQDLALIGSASKIDRRAEPATFDGGDVRAPGVEALVDARDRFYWIRVPRVLSYYTATGPARVTLDGVAREGLGLLEHAWGAQTRLDVARLAPRRWRWDVLSLGGDRFCAGLAIHGAGFRGAARLDDGLVGVRRLAVRGGVDRWRGVMHTRRGALRYEARTATPVSPEVDGGGFVGFTWEGDLDGARVSGAGFSEFRRA